MTRVPRMHPQVLRQQGPRQPSRVATRIPARLRTLHNLVIQHAGQGRYEVAEAAVPPGPGGPGAGARPLPPPTWPPCSTSWRWCTGGGRRRRAEGGTLLGSAGAPCVLLYSTGYLQGWGGRGRRSGETTETWAESWRGAADPPTE